MEDLQETNRSIVYIFMNIQIIPASVSVFQGFFFLITN